MTLYETIDLLKKIALKHPNIGSASEGNIYEYMNANPSVKYGVFFITQGTHSQDEMFNHFEFTLFYVDRLVDDMEENRLQIQSIGKEMLSNILTFFCEEFDAECDNITYQPFTQKFVDMTAGIYSTITIDVPKDVICPEEYWNENWVAPVTVIRNQDKRVVFTENGTYTIDYDPTTYTGLGNVEVNVNIDVDSYYNQGKTDGVNEQKSKLSQITISENGTYSKEDGYSEVVVDVPDLNGDYNEGYEQGQADVAANARVLEVTENGNYLSKFSDPIVPELVTGVYADGTGFYSYAELNGKVFNTNIPATKDSRIEFWWKNDATYNRYATIIGGQTDEGYIFKFAEYSINTYRIEYGNHMVGNLFYHNFDYDMTSRWNHIIFSKQDGLYVNDELICEAQGERWGENETIPNFWINAAYLGEVDNNANGTFGMIKINDTIIIPTADGFQNVNTGELLEVVQNGSYTFTENLPIYPKGELYKTINVNVIPKINVKEAGVKFAYSTFAKVPEWADFTGLEDLESMFRSSRLQTLEGLDFSITQNMAYAFQYCPLTNLDYFTPSNSLLRINNAFEGCGNLRIIPNMDLSSVLDANGLFDSCGSIEEIGDINFENATTLVYFLKCYGDEHPIRKIGVFNVPKVETISDFFYYSFSPVTRNNLTEMGGFIGLKCNWDSGNGLDSCPNLTYQSCINILNGLADVKELGGRTLKVHPNFLTTVGDEISIGTLKGWSITSN